MGAIYYSSDSYGSWRPKHSSTHWRPSSTYVLTLWSRPSFSHVWKSGCMIVWVYCFEDRKKKEQNYVAPSTSFRVRPRISIYISFLHSLLFGCLSAIYPSFFPSSLFLFVSSFRKYLLSIMIFIHCTSFLFRSLLASALYPSTCFILPHSQKSLKFSA